MKALILGSSDLEFDGGGERNAIQTANILLQMGYDVTLMGSGLPFKRKDHVDVKFRYIPSAFGNDIFSNAKLMNITNGISMGFVGLFSFRKIWQLIQGYDLYVFQTPNFLFMNAVKMFNKYGYTPKIILENHGSYFEILDQYRLLRNLLKIVMNRLIFSSVSGKITVQVQNKKQYNFYQERGFGDIRLIPQNNIDFSRYSISNHIGFNVVFLNKLTKNKGKNMLYKIIKKMDDKNIHFDIIGYGNINKLRKKFKKYNVTFHGFIDENKKEELLSNGDVMLNLSTYEALSISSIEGLASGLFVIGPRISGIEYLKSNVHEIILTDYKYSKFISEIKKVKNFKSDINYYKIRENIRNTSCNIFDQKKIINNISKMVNDTDKTCTVDKISVILTINTYNNYQDKIDSLLRSLTTFKIPADEIFILNNTKHEIISEPGIHIVNNQNKYIGTEELRLIHKSRNSHVMVINERNNPEDMVNLFKNIKLNYDLIVGSRYVLSSLKNIKDLFDLSIIKATNIFFPNVNSIKDILSDFYIVNKNILNKNESYEGMYKSLLYLLIFSNTRNIREVRVHSSKNKLIMEDNSVLYYSKEIVICFRDYHKLRLWKHNNEL